MIRVDFDLRQQRELLGLSQARLAELSGIPQHMLSALELGKIEPTPEVVDTLESLLSNKSAVKAIAERRKRYQKHRYKRIEHAPDRVARAARTEGNSDYLNALHTLDILSESQRSGIRAISLFSGCGGLSLGFAAAGLHVAGYLEIEPGLRRIYHTNFPNALEIGGDITAVNHSQLTSLSGELLNIDVIIGGPPCQGFSLSGKRRVDDPRNSLFRHYLRFVDAFRPRVAVLENVRLLTSMKSPAGTLVKDEIVEAFHRHGYSASMFEVNAKCYGVPQHRERVFFVATRNDTGISPSFPAPTHGVDTGLFGTSEGYRTFGDACSDLPYIESGEAIDDPLHRAVKHPAHVIEWLWDVPEGFSAHDNDDPSLRPPSGYNTTYKRQVWSEPASTVQTTFGMISGCRNVHPIATRSLTIREAARIQSFPDWFRFEGKSGVVRTAIGNAVPPLLAKTVADHILSHML